MERYGCPQLAVVPACRCACQRAGRGHPRLWWYTACYDGLGLSAVAAVLIGAHRNRTHARLTWYLLAAGQLLFVVGDLLFDLHERVWQTTTLPSTADGLYLSGYVPLAIGLVLLIRARSPGKDRASLIDATIVATGLGLLSWTFLMKPAASDSALPMLGRIIAVAYPAADMLLSTRSPSVAARSRCPYWSWRACPG
jgi:hypothetical protein